VATIRVVLRGVEPHALCTISRAETGREAAPACGIERQSQIGSARYLACSRRGYNAFQSRPAFTSSRVSRHFSLSRVLVSTPPSVRRLLLRPAPAVGGVELVNDSAPRRILRSLFCAFDFGLREDLYGVRLSHGLELCYRRRQRTAGLRSRPILRAHTRQNRALTFFS